MLLQYKALGAVAVVVGAFFFGSEWTDRAWAEKVAKAENENKALVIELERAQKQAEYLLLDSVNDILEQVDSETEVIYREKIIYRDNPNAGNCVIPGEWVQIHNNSTGMPGVSSATPDIKAEARAEEISDIEVLDIVTANYRMCVEEIAKFDGLWQWATEQAR